MDKPNLYLIGRMWDQKNTGELFYIKKNNDVIGEEHWHDCFEIELVLDGTCDEIINGNVIPVKKGDAILITPADLHEVANINDLVIYNLMFSVEVIDADIGEQILLINDHILSCSLNENEYDYLLELLDRANTEYSLKNTFYEHFVTDAINQLLIIMLRHYKNVIKNKKELSIVTAAYYLRMHFKENPTLEEVAKIVHLDSAYFSVRFCETIGIPFKRYLNQLKTSYAAKLLSDTNMTVSEVCYESGFESLSNFHREFKKRYSVSPLDYRKNIK